MINCLILSVLNLALATDRFIEKNGTIDELCDPVTLLEGRGVNGEDVIIDGNTTIGSATLSKVVKELPFQTIPYDIHKNYTDKELGWFGTALNEENEKVVIFSQTQLIVQNCKT